MNNICVVKNGGGCRGNESSRQLAIAEYTPWNLTKGDCNAGRGDVNERKI